LLKSHEVAMDDFFDIDRVIRNATTIYNLDGFIDRIANKDLAHKILDKLRPYHAEILWRCAVNDEKQKNIAKEKRVSNQAINQAYMNAIRAARKIAQKL